MAEPVPEKPFAENQDVVPPMQDGRSFMDRIPDVEEDYPDAPEVSAVLTDPSLGQEITPDDSAMDSHGMLGHGEEEPPFDMSILDDPEFALPQEPEPLV